VMQLEWTGNAAPPREYTSGKECESPMIALHGSQGRAVKTADRCR